MGPLTLKIFKSKYFIGPIIIVSIIITSILIYFISIKDKIIFPNLENYRCGYYTDKANGGNSQILNYIASDSILKIDFDLSEGFFSPYVGISITPDKGEFIDAGKYNQIRLKLKGQSIGRLGVSIYTPPVSLSKNNKQDQALFHTYLNITNKIETYSIPIEQLEAPEWWKDFHGIPSDILFKPDLSRILHFNIGSGYTPNINIQMSLEIYSITFTRDNHLIFMTLSILEVITILILFLIHYLVELFKSKRGQITVFYKPLDYHNKEEQIESYIEYICNNYQNSELSLELVSKETSIPQRRITKSIQSKFNCNFKTYINRIRINESTRFLLQTNLNIGEIAFKVGFNNQSNFNRVFKSELDISPSEYREKHKS